MKGDKNIVTFQEFLETHIVVDYIWEIFKGISPTIIALITIAINTKINKRKEKRDRKEKELKELQVKIAGLIPYVVKNGADVLQVIQNAENKERTEMFFDIYEEENTQMLIAAREYQAYEKVRLLKKENTESDENDVLMMVSQYASALQDILEWYNKEAVGTDIIYFNKLCDSAKEKCMDAERTTENALIEYSKRLGEI